MYKFTQSVPLEQPFSHQNKNSLLSNTPQSPEILVNEENSFFDDIDILQDLSSPIDPDEHVYSIVDAQKCTDELFNHVYPESKVGNRRKRQIDNGQDEEIYEEGSAGSNIVKSKSVLDILDINELSQSFILSIIGDFFTIDENDWYCSELLKIKNKFKNIKTVSPEAFYKRSISTKAESSREQFCVDGLVDNVKALLSCGCVMDTRYSYNGGAVIMRIHDQPARKNDVKFSGLQSCRQNICPSCIRFRNYLNRQIIKYSINEIHKEYENPSLSFISMTARHTVADGDISEDIKTAFTKFNGHRYLRKLLEEYNYFGRFRWIDVTYSQKNGFHTHFHGCYGWDGPAPTMELTMRDQMIWGGHRYFERFPILFKDLDLEEIFGLKKYVKASTRKYLKDFSKLLEIRYFSSPDKALNLDWITKNRIKVLVQRVISVSKAKSLDLKGSKEDLVTYFFNQLQWKYSESFYARFVYIWKTCLNLTKEGWGESLSLEKGVDVREIKRMGEDKSQLDRICDYALKSLTSKVGGLLSEVSPEGKKTKASTSFGVYELQEAYLAYAQVDNFKHPLSKSHIGKVIKRYNGIVKGMELLKFYGRFRVYKKDYKEMMEEKKDTSNPSTLSMDNNLFRKVLQYNKKQDLVSLGESLSGNSLFEKISGLDGPVMEMAEELRQKERWSLSKEAIYFAFMALTQFEDNSASVFEKSGMSDSWANSS